MSNLNRSVGVVIVNTGGWVLMQLRDDKVSISYPGYWSLPGGKVEDGENIEAAAKRELEEETGLANLDLAFVTKESWTNDKGVEIQRNIFLGRYDGVSKVECYEGQKMEFIDPEKFPQMKIFPGHEKLISLAITKLGSL